jgi:hypothetical protein
LLFPDHDKNGYGFVHDIAVGIHSAVQSLKLVSIPVPNGPDAAGYDIYDYLHEHNPWLHTETAAAKLQALVESAAETTPDAINELKSKLFAEITTTGCPSPGLPEQSLEMPENCMYGKAMKLAYALDLPLSVAYPTVLAFCSVLPGVEPSDKYTRTQLYVVLIGLVGGCKSEVFGRATELISLPKEKTVRQIPASDRGLEKLLGNTGQTILVVIDELRNMFSKMSIQNSSLASTWCTLWKEDEAGTADKNGSHPIIARPSFVGALAANDPTEFAEVFNLATNYGFYDRCLFGVISPGWKWTKPQPMGSASVHVVLSQIPDSCYERMYKWRDAKEGRNPRLGEHAMRVALITSCVNGDKVVTDKAMQAAFHFMEWQEEIRERYRAGFAKSLAAECAGAILDSIPKGGFLKWNLTLKKKNWNKKYADLTQKVRDGLVKDNVIEYDRHSGKVRLKDD